MTLEEFKEQHGFKGWRIALNEQFNNGNVIPSTYVRTFMDDLEKLLRDSEHVEEEPYHILPGENAQ